MKILNVELGDRSYPIYIGSGLLEDAKIITSHIKTKTICIVSNTTVSKLYLENLKNILDDYRKADEGIYGYLKDPDADRIIEMVRKL